MGDLISSIFIDPNALTGSEFDQFCQTVFLIVVYGFILLKASQLISGGAQLLLLTPYAGLIGSVVLPVLGAVPDGAIVLFSGMGPNAKEQIQVGVGALAGSTIMLLTVPWFLANLGGRVDLDEEGKGKYTQRPRLTRNMCACTSTGSNPARSVQVGGILIALTMIPYIVVQIGGFLNPLKGEGPPHDQIKWLVFAAFILAILLFIMYLVYQVTHQDDKAKTDKVEELKLKAVQNGTMSFSGAFQVEIQEIINNADGSMNSEEKLSHALRTFFNRYDADKSGAIDKHELRILLEQIGEKDMLRDREFQGFLTAIDKDKNGVVDFREFREAFEQAFRHNAGGSGYRKSSTKYVGMSGTGNEPLIANEEEDHEQDEEEEEMPDDIARLPPDQQQRAIKIRAFMQMFFGTVLVLIFADPMVGALNKFGSITGIPAFFVAFILAPLASNASEILAAYSFAQKKTVKHVTISFSQLQGAACMNNTFCLGIFLIIIFAKEDLTWEYSSEALGILITEVIMIFISLRKTQTLLLSFLVFLMFPLSICLILIFENAIGWN